MKVGRNFRIPREMCVFLKMFPIAIMFLRHPKVITEVVWKIFLCCVKNYLMKH